MARAGEGSALYPKLTVHDPMVEDAALLEAWDQLASEAIEPNPFGESWFMLPGLRLFDDERRARLFALWRDEGELAGIIALAPSHRYGRFPVLHSENWVHPNCFLGTPLVLPGWEEAFWRAVLGAMDADRLTHPLLYLVGLVQDGPVYQGLQIVAATEGRGCDIVLRESRAMVQTGLTAQEYWDQNVRGKKRKELRRQSARLAELGTLRFERLGEGDDVDAWVARFLDLERTGWKGEEGSALGADARTSGFFREVLKGAHQRGQLDGLTLWLDDKPIAMLCHFLSGQGGFSFKTAYDEDYARFSPGVLIQRENLELLGRAGLGWIDSCAAQNHSMINSLWAERREIVRVAVAVGGARNRLIFNGIRSLERLRAWTKRKKGQA